MLAAAMIKGFNFTAQSPPGPSIVVWRVVKVSLNLIERRGRVSFYALAVVLAMVLTSGVLLAGGATAQAEPAAAGTASTFASVSPVRVLDTRTGIGGVSGPVSGTVTLDLAGRVPVAATAVVLNVTGVAPTASTFVTVFPAGTGRPLTSNLNLPAGDTRPIQVTVALGVGRKVSLYNNAGRIHLVADLAGYYRAGAGAKFTPLTPNRVLDTRDTLTPLGPGATRNIDLSQWMPASATAVTVNLTATNATATTFVTAWPTGRGRPAVSNLNVPAGDTRPNLVTVAVGANRQISLYNNAGSVDLLVDMGGFYTPDYGAFFVPLPPSRVLDTRDGTGTGGSTDPLGEGRDIARNLADGLPLTATGVVLNVTGVAATDPTHLLAWGVLWYGRWRPSGSTLNLPAGQAASNAAVMAFNGDRGFLVRNSVGAVHVVADLVGVFVALDQPCVTDCLYAWGYNDQRKLGTAEAVYSSSTPTPVVLSGVRAVAGGVFSNGYALRTDGTVWAWGNNETGQLGNGWTGRGALGAPNGSVVPAPVVGLADVTAIAGGSQQGYALRADGTVWAWGQNGSGALGNGSDVQSNVPVQVTGLTDIVAIAGNPGSGFAVRADGTVWAWGSGFLGSPQPPFWSLVPVQVGGLTGVTAITGNGSGAYVLRTDGTVWGWGSGQLGIGPCGTDTGVPCSSEVPVRVSGLAGVTAIAGTFNNGYAVRDDGTVWAWGSNVDGALGNGVPCDPTATVCESQVPVRVSGLHDVTQIAGFGAGGYALRTDGTVWAWGDNRLGQLGNDSVTGHTTVPVQVIGLTGVSAIDSGGHSGYAVVRGPLRGR
jgi:alpha-tubulin suppressor-like RCC1 family protein